MLKQDYELSRDDIQLLSSRDALAALFAKLGYDTNDRLIQNVAARSHGFFSRTSMPIPLVSISHPPKALAVARRSNCSFV